MAKRGRTTGNLARLEKQLAEANALRARIITNIKAVVAGLTAGTSYLVAAERKEFGPAAKRAAKRTRKFSKAARAKLAAAAKKRWAEAKKAGKTKLG